MLVSASALTVHGVGHRSLMQVSALDVGLRCLANFHFIFLKNPSIQEEETELV